MSQSSAPAESVGSAFWADKLGTWASALCVVHCLLTPVLLSFSVVLAHMLPSEERTHRSLALLVATLGAIALLRGFRAHHRPHVLLFVAAGLGCIFAAAWWGDRLPAHWVEVMITFVGSGLMITAHRLNHTFCRSCRRCTPSTQGGSGEKPA